MNIRTTSIYLLAVFMVLSAASCGKKNLKNNASATGMTTDISADPSLDIQDGDAPGSEGNIRGGEFASHETIQPVYFDFDRYGLSEETRKTLQKNAETLKAHKEWLVLVEGHSITADRNTTCLGTEKSQASPRLLHLLGRTERPRTILWEEKPSCEVKRKNAGPRTEKPTQK